MPSSRPVLALGESGTKATIDKVVAAAQVEDLVGAVEGLVGADEVGVSESAPAEAEGVVGSAVLAESIGRRKAGTPLSRR